MYHIVTQTHTHTLHMHTLMITICTLISLPFFTNICPSKRQSTSYMKRPRTEEHQKRLNKLAELLEEMVTMVTCGAET